MGVDFYAQALIGVKIPRRKAFTVRRVRAFTHDLPEDWKVDPKTGRELWKNGNVNLVEEWLEVAKSSGRFTELTMATDGSSEDDAMNVYLACGLVTHRTHIGEGDEPAGVVLGLDLRDGQPGHQLRHDYEKLQEFLAPLGLWDPGTFGLWVVPYVSV